MSELKNKRSVVFIGDSITDAGRTYPTVSEYGYGYAALCIEAIKKQYPHALLFNRGVAGECIVEIYKRFEKDCLDLHPALVTFMAGVNDVDYSYRKENYPFHADLLEKELFSMCKSVKDTGAKLIMMEPYAFEGELYHDAFYPRMEILQDIVRRAAKQYADAYIVLPMTKEMTLEGVHPTQEGHRLIYEHWMKAARDIGALDFLR